MSSSRPPLAVDSLVGQIVGSSFDVLIDDPPARWLEEIARQTLLIVASSLIARQQASPSLTIEDAIAHLICEAQQ